MASSIALVRDRTRRLTSRCNGLAKTRSTRAEGHAARSARESANFRSDLGFFRSPPLETTLRARLFASPPMLARGARPAVVR